MKKLTEEVRVVKSITQQIIDSPIESVFVVQHTPTYRAAGHWVRDSLVKTGSDGYRSARGDAVYLSGCDIDNWVKSFGDNAEFYMF